MMRRAKMDCRTCRSLLGDFAADRLAADARPSVRSHLLECAECRDVERLLREGLDFPAVAAPDGLVDDVLRDTSGPACGRAAELACDLVDERLSGLDLELMQLHLGECTNCARLVETLGVLDEHLPAMARIDPGPAFTREILEGFAASAPVSRPRWSEAWRTLWQRPRFALELAYVGAAMLWIAFSLAGSPLDEQATRVAKTPAVRRLAEAPQAVPRVVARATSFGEAAWTSAGERGAQTMRSVRSDLDRRMDRSLGARRALRRDGARLRDAAVQLDIRSGYSALGQVSGDLADIFKQFAANPNEPPNALDRS